MAEGAVRALVPMAHVASIAQSVAFYQRLGFEIRNAFTPPAATEPSWVSLSTGGDGEPCGAELMLARADAPVVADQQAVLFYLYCADVAAMHAKLAGSGLAVGPITMPFYNPRGEFRLSDPDGYVIFIAHL